MVGENAVLGDGESAGFADGLRIAGEREGARIEGLGLNVSGADKQRDDRKQMPHDCPGQSRFHLVRVCQALPV